MKRFVQAMRVEEIDTILPVSSPKDEYQTRIASKSGNVVLSTATPKEVLREATNALEDLELRRLRFQHPSGDAFAKIQEMLVPWLDGGKQYMNQSDRRRLRRLLEGGP